MSEDQVNSADTLWLAMPSPPREILEGSIAQCDDHSFLIAPNEWKAFKKNDICRFDVASGRWEMLTQNMVHFQNLFLKNNVAADNQSDQLHIVHYIHANDGYEYGLMELDLKTHRVEVKSVSHDFVAKSRFVICCNGKLHFFSRKWHAIWNGVVGSGASFELVFDINRRRTDFNWVIGVPSKGIILALVYYEYHMSWECKFWVFCVKTKRWKRTGIRCNMTGPSAVVSACGDYVILAGKRGQRSKPSRMISVLDIRIDGKYKLFDSQVCIAVFLDVQRTICYQLLF